MPSLRSLTFLFCKFFDIISFDKNKPSMYSRSSIGMILILIKYNNFLFFTRCFIITHHMIPLYHNFVFHIHIHFFSLPFVKLRCLTSGDTWYSKIPNIRIWHIFYYTLYKWLLLATWIDNPTDAFTLAFSPNQQLCNLTWIFLNNYKTSWFSLMSLEYNSKGSFILNHIYK